MRQEKFEHLRRAKELLAAGDEASLRYCCLELRTCIELVAYALVPLYEKELRRDFDKWRPQDVIDALLDCAPDADKDYTLRMGPEAHYGEPAKKMFVVGHFKGLTRKFVQRHYHKLGSFLHAPTFAQLSSGSPPIPDKAFLEETITAVDELCSSSVISNFAMRVSLDCQDCGKPISRNTEALKRDGKLICLEPTCKAEYTVEDLDSDLPKFRIVQLDFECVSCKTKNYVGQHRLKDGLTITCCNCPAKFHLDRIWRISRIGDA
jgi:hypothetical protein